MAVAADPGGHFTLYSSPDPRSGLPTTDSHQFLRGCVGDGFYANEASIWLKTHEISPAGVPVERVMGLADPVNTARETARAGDSLVTTYRFFEGLALAQRLTLTDQGLNISYQVSNTSDGDRSLSFRSLLSPTLANETQKVLFTAGGANGELRSERTLTADDGRLGPVGVPRPAAAGDSTAGWRPSGTGPRPYKITFAPYEALIGPPFHHDLAERSALPPSASMAVYWSDIRLGPGDRISLSHSFGPENR